MHKSVLLQEVISGLNPTKGDIVVDCTINGAGHAIGLLNATKGGIELIGLDADPEAIKRADARLKEAGFEAKLVNENFRMLDTALSELGITKVHKFLFDLGWSSDQLDSGRGFSFQKNEPLDMSFGKTGRPYAFSAEAIVNEWDEENIVAILIGYGEERYAKGIARGIVRTRMIKPIKTTNDLVSVIKASTPTKYHFGKIHPATRTFQALRIAVNDELGAIEEGLKKAFDFLHTEGRIAVISFHSIEDRIVKWLFKEWATNNKGISLSKKPIVATEEEIEKNPRARSAKLRVFEKQNTQ